MKQIIKKCLENVIASCKKYKVDFYKILKEIEDQKNG